MCAGPQDTNTTTAADPTSHLNNNGELNEFEKQGIQFRVITEYMVPACLDFLWDQFAPQVGVAISFFIVICNGILTAFVLFCKC